MGKEKKDKKKKKGKKSLASRADRFDLYQRSVQSPDFEVGFASRAFKKAFARRAVVLREDFCGTAAVCCEWVKSKKDRVAFGVDLDKKTLSWGAVHNVGKLKDGQAERVTLIEGDVRSADSPPADIIAAQNFSYFCFKTRDELRGYFERAYANLADQGLLVVDAMGGSQTYEEGHQDKRRVGSFRYIWDQQRFDPITHHATMAIHFEFKDGSRLKRAFVYDWRLWILPEIRELLLEAGFPTVKAYWEDTDKETGEGSGRYRPRSSAEADPAWVSYVVAIKDESGAKSE